MLLQFNAECHSAETRKEEIARFSKAKADPDFAKMLKARTLGPEAAETQSQLRKQIRVSAEIVKTDFVLILGGSVLC